ncbi:MAG: hypothetical protein CYPHOPRED_000110 [Cyphobasidiales sp. Tagirdzhanova-0007]|nr:MAG: hypothetical protein CYPHOPRED_000110 [Cyphobasidiales sp. Tagirdzhanova-0007]
MTTINLQQDPVAVFLYSGNVRFLSRNWQGTASFSSPLKSVILKDQTDEGLARAKSLGVDAPWNWALTPGGELIRNPSRACAALPKGDGPVGETGSGSESGSGSGPDSAVEENEELTVNSKLSAEDREDLMIS